MTEELTTDSRPTVDDTCAMCSGPVDETAKMNADELWVCQNCQDENPYWYLGVDVSDDRDEPFTLWLNNMGHDAANVGELPDWYEQFKDAYRGDWDTVQQYAEEIIADVYDLERMMGSLAHYFDYEAFARDLELGGDIWSERGESGRLHIFDNH